MCSPNHPLALFNVVVRGRIFSDVRYGLSESA
jgi:hypothetical protein